MASATANTATPVGVASRPLVNVWPYRNPRSRGAFLCGEAILLSLAFLLSLAGEFSAGTMVLILSCTVTFRINRLPQTVVSARESRFWVDFLESVSLGILVSACVFYLFPPLVPTLGSALWAVIMTGRRWKRDRWCSGGAAEEPSFRAEATPVCQKLEFPSQARWSVCRKL